MNLFVDIGNSRIKWASSVNSILEDYGVFKYREENLADLFNCHWQGLPDPEQVYVSNVGGQEVADIMSVFIKQQWGISPVFASVEREYGGLVNAYQETEQLGIDRWLAMIAAWNRYHAALIVVSCGTAITIDGVSDSGNHMGGLIIPGHEMMQKALIKETHGIQEHNSDSYLLNFGNNTSECIANGSAYAVVSLIDRIVGEMKTEHDNELYRIITGGYAESVNSMLSNKFDLDPSLVLEGLSVVADIRL